MNFLLFHLKRLVMLPFRLVSSPAEMISSLWNDSGRSRALLLGLPSIVFALLGIGLLLWAKYVVADALENRYVAELEQSSLDKRQVLGELRRETRMLEASQPTGAEIDPTKPLIPEDDPRRVELETLHNREKILLEKLIDLNPDESEYLFQLALVAYEKRDINRCLALMQMTAPVNEPGYTKSHLWLAKFFMESPAKTRNEQIRNIGLALTHAEQCLKRDPKNIPANLIKANLLYLQNRNPDSAFQSRGLEVAYGIYEDLFQENPRIFVRLVEINKLLRKAQRNEKVLEMAIERFEQQLDTDSLNIAEQVAVLRDLMACFLEKKQYARAESRLSEEIKRFSESEENSGRVWAERALADVYMAWIGAIEKDDSEVEKKKLALLKKAYQLYPRNESLLAQLTRLGISNNAEVAQEAISIYDATSDPDAPAIVLNEIGSQALARSDYVTALRNFEMARKKAPRNPEILNNLAYTYIVGDDPNPKRGLTMVDEALRRLPNNSESKGMLTFLRDTRGQALMQLDKWTEAAADFEFALIDRPKNKKILEALIKCYRADGLDPSAYVERLRAVNEEEPENEEPENSQDQGGQSSDQ